jgi:hypothetical protein
MTELARSESATAYTNVWLLYNHADSELASRHLLRNVVTVSAMSHAHMKVRRMETTPVDI